MALEKLLKELDTSKTLYQIERLAKLLGEINRSAVQAKTEDNTGIVLVGKDELESINKKILGKIDELLGE